MLVCGHPGVKDGPEDDPLQAAQLIPGGYEPQVHSYTAALFEAVRILQGEHERERRERPDPLDLAREIGFGVAFFGDGLQLAVVLANALGERAYLCSRMGPKAGQSASGMCSGALLWKLLAGHLGRRHPKALTAP